MQDITTTPPTVFYLISRGIRRPDKAIYFLYQYIKRFCMKAKYKDWNKFYSEFINSEAQIRPVKAIGAKWDTSGEYQIKFLKEQGLKPYHKFLDIGCGCLRGGRNIIKYLDDNNYIGSDISSGILKEAFEIAKENNLWNKQPLLILTKDFSFNEFRNNTFDYLHAISVITHAPIESVEELFKNVSKVMNKNSKFLLTFHESKTGSPFIRAITNFYYPFQDLKQLAKKHNLKAVNLGRYKYTQSSMMLLTKMS